MRKLEIGGGRNAVEGYEILDCKPGVQHIAKWGYERLPFADETFDEVYSSHTIEHIPWYNVESALKEVYRILKPGGVVEIHTLNFRYMVDHYLAKKVGDGWNGRGRNKEMHPFVWVSSRLFNLGDTSNPGDPNWHKSLFDWDYLVYLFKKTGFKNFERLKKQKGNKTRSPVNIGIRGIK
jgi:predicted SAM-dependent methyltransferase